MELCWENVNGLDLLITLEINFSLNSTRNLFLNMLKLGLFFFKMIETEVECKDYLFRNEFQVLYNIKLIHKHKFQMFHLSNFILKRNEIFGSLKRIEKGHQLIKKIFRFTVH